MTFKTATQGVKAKVWPVFWSLATKKRQKRVRKGPKQFFSTQVSGSSGTSDYCEAEPSVTPLHAQQRLCMVGREIREVSITILNLR